MRGNAPSIGAASDRLARTVRLVDDASRLRYVSGARETALDHLGLVRVRDVLLHAPHRYIDCSDPVPIARADVGLEATVVGRVDKVTAKRPRPRMSIVELAVIDQTGVVMATFFKQPWIADQVHSGDLVVLRGKVTFAFGFKQMKAPTWFEVLDGSTGSRPRVLPVHSVGEGVSVAWMRRIVSAALADSADVCDWLPASLVARRGLMTLSRALRCLHFPSTMQQGERARRRLAYDELVCLQLALMCRQHLDLDGATPHVHVTCGPHMASLRASLPFALSDEQETALSDVLSDMSAPRVMNRLLLGDVGTGKTVVAALALAACADSSTQGAVMAPTSVLARQYADKVGPLLDAAGVPWTLLTGATPADERARTCVAIAAGDVSVTFGTTAVLSADVDFSDLSLVVIDEQHRFGVDQRAALREKGRGADMLAMTATPIPRTLALSVYGDLDCSRIRRRPRKGAGVSTTVLTPENVDQAYGAIRECVAAGQQAYVVCPLVDDSDKGEGLDEVVDETVGTRPLHSARSTQEELSGRVLKGMRVGLLTGRLSSAEKDDVMGAFRDGRLDVLVSTTVIEVGVDVPAATVMLVWDADRFGLATLHQLRGRVGRGDVSGRVFLVSAARRGTPARKRLSALEATTDGLELADLDLRLRHEGEVLGYRQHGGVTLGMVDLAVDGDLVEMAHVDALDIVRDDPRLDRPWDRTMALEVRDRFGAYFEEGLGS
jgi:ATP-dependent DNA helicase RecG